MYSGPWQVQSVSLLLPYKRPVSSISAAPDLPYTPLAFRATFLIMFAGVCFKRGQFLYVPGHGQNLRIPACPPLLALDGHGIKAAFLFQT